MQEKFSQNDAFSYRLKVAIKASGLKQKEIAKKSEYQKLPSPATARVHKYQTQQTFKNLLAYLACPYHRLSTSLPSCR